jgi:hypothetical protein
VKIDDVYHGHVTPESLTELVNRAIEGKDAMQQSEATNG